MAIPGEGISATGTGVSEDMGRTAKDPDMIIANIIYILPVVAAREYASE